MSFLVSGIFGDEVEVFTADDESSVHLGRDNGSGQDTATDGDETSEWALLVYSGQMLACSAHGIAQYSGSPEERQSSLRVVMVLSSPPPLVSTSNCIYAADRKSAQISTFHIPI